MRLSIHVDETQRHLKMPIGLTRIGLVAERITHAFWPLWTVFFVGLAPLIMGWQDDLPIEAVWAWAVLVVLGLGWALWRGVRQFRWPTRGEAVERVDARLPGRPIAALDDTQAIGAGDAASEAVWQAHLRRMEERTREARAVEPDLRVSRRDPFGLRYVALLIFLVALMFGSLLRVGSVVEAGPGGTATVATGPVWEGWVEPPAYTGKPTLYLADLTGRKVRVPQGSMITLRLYGETGALSVAETVSGRTGEVPPASDVQQSFPVTQSGQLEIMGEGGEAWEVIMEPDAAPTVTISAPLEVEADGQMSQPFLARDDHGVVAGQATFTLDLAEVDRRHGLTIDPDPVEPLVLDLPMPFTGDRTEFEEALIDDLSQHPWANLPVVMVMQVEDALGQTGRTSDIEMILPGRRFFQPIAKAVIEQRRDLLWSKANAPRIAQILRAVSHRPDDLFTNEPAYLRLRVTLRRLEAEMEGGLSDEAQAEIAEALWDLAVLLEEGSLSDARERLERAQERLAEAMRDGASDEEIQELMNELREAMDDYMRMLAQNAQPREDGTDQPDQRQGESMDITRDELQALMDRIQELMEEGRMAEAQELMEQLNELMQNLQVTQGEGGDGPQTPGEQSMQDLAETLRDQQQLNDDAFRELQEQFNQGQQGQQGQQEGQQEGQQQGGQQPGQQQGQQGQGQPGQEGQQGQQGQGMGQGDNNTGGLTDEGGPGGEGGGLEGSLADRQRSLREGLNQLRNALPGLTGDAAERAEDALGRAEGAMEGAEDALREGDMAEAIDRQSEALDALRDGMRNLGEALAENQRDELEQGQGTQTGQAEGRPEPQRRDPLGRQMGNAGQFGSEENMLQDEDVYRRAEELLKELRDRSADQERPKLELDYLRRLLERF